MTGAAEHAFRHRLQWENMAGLDEIIGGSRGISQEPDGQSAVGGGNAGGDSFSGIDADGEGGFVALAVAASHLREHQLFRALGGEGRTNQAASMDRHKINHRGSTQGGGTGEIGFVFTRWIIGDDDQPTGGEFCDNFRNRAKNKRRI